MAKTYLPDLWGRSTGEMFSSLQHEIDRVFSDFGRGLPSMPGFGKGTEMKVNVAETDGALEVTAEIPGVDAKDIDVQLKDGVLTIKGEKKDEKEEKDEKKNYHLVERSYGMFQRSFAVGADVDADKINASFDKGVLKVTLPKLPAAKAKVQKIEVKPA
ncbi:MAG TPA: Hsp20/alpha crystallin family protein [Aestuariivirga sp.]|nr:Hsp20/alpha crystallin family protein [Aestuariivirga sp.]